MCRPWTIDVSYARLSNSPLPIPRLLLLSTGKPRRAGGHTDPSKQMGKSKAAAAASSSNEEEAAELQDLGSCFLVGWLAGTV